MKKRFEAKIDLTTKDTKKFTKCTKKSINEHE
jgi:hypothetical protein